MPETRQVGLWIAAAGVLLAVLGLTIATGALSWFGRLPGDLRVELGERGRGVIFVPLTSMLLVSLGLSALARLLRRIL